jgi:hypothetical protein
VTSLTFTENATPVVQAIARAASSRGAALSAGVGLRKGVMSWLRDVQRRQMKHEQDLPGSIRTGFYERAAQSTTAPEVEGNKVSVAITERGFRQRYRGGDIEPGEGKKYLTLPGWAPSYGTRAPEWTAGTTLLWGKDKTGTVRPIAIISTEGLEYSGTKSARSRNKQASRLAPEQILFWLVTQVHQEGDPTILPPPEAIQAYATEGLRAYLRTRGLQPGEGQ